jgi:hypothetical protein
MSTTVQPNTLSGGDLVTVTGYFADFNSYHCERMTLLKPKDIVVLRKPVVVGDKVICYENEEVMVADKDGQVGTVRHTDGFNIHVDLLLLAEKFKIYSCYTVQRATVEQVAAAEKMLAEKMKQDAEKAARLAVDALDRVQRLALVQEIVIGLSPASAPKK